MSNNRNRRRPPMSVAEARAALERAERREVNDIFQSGGQTYETPPRPRVSVPRPNVDLATLDTPDVSHADQWADFLNRPGKFYVGKVEIPLDDDGMGQKLGATTTFKANDDQLPYLVEVLRQVRGAFGAHTRISLTPAEPSEPHIHQAEQVGDHAPVTARRRAAARAAVTASQKTGRPVDERVARLAEDDELRRIDELIERSSLGASAAKTARDRVSTKEAEAIVRRANELREELSDYEAGYQAGLANSRGELYTPPNGPPMVPGVDFTLGEREPVDPSVPPWACSVPGQEYTREALAQMLPGQTRAEIAKDLGRTPESFGGTVHAADVMPEELAAELGVPVESLTRIPMTGGGYAWTVTPPRVEERGRHAAPDGGDR